MARVLYLYSQALRSDSVHARQTFQMLALMRDAEIQVDVLTLPGGDTWPQGLAAKIYRTARVPFVRTLPPYGTGFRRRWATIVLALAAVRLFLCHKYDAIHCADRSVRVGVLIAWLFNTRFIFEWHAASGHDLVSWLKRRKQRMLRSVQLILSDVPYSFARLRETELCGRIASLPLLPAPHITRLAPPPHRFPGQETPFRLLAISQERDLDDLAILYETLPRLIAHPHLHITIAGGTPATLERLRTRLITRLQDISRITFTCKPATSQGLMELLQPADAVFIPPVSGPLPPPVLLDIMAAQRAIMAVRCNAWNGLLNAANALLIPAKATDFFATLLRLMESPFLTTELAVSAADTIERDRNSREVIAEIRRCYTFALTEPRH